MRNTSCEHKHIRHIREKIEINPKELSLIHIYTSLGFTAGFTGNEIKRLLGKKGVNTDFIEVEDGISRINAVSYTHLDVYKRQAMYLENFIQMI